MPIEHALLANRPEVFERCPVCGAMFESLMRGMVHNAWKKFWGKPYCAVICWRCKEIVGHEKP